MRSVLGIIFYRLEFRDGIHIFLYVLTVDLLDESSWFASFIKYKKKIEKMKKKIVSISKIRLEFCSSLLTKQQIKWKERKNIWEASLW